MEEKRTVGVDFETFYKSSLGYTLKTMDAVTYCTHPLFDAQIISAYDGQKSIVCHPDDFDWEFLTEADVVSFNASFDYCVYKYGLGCPNGEKFSQWLCCMASANYLGFSGDLSKVVWSLFRQKVSKDTRTNADGHNWILNEETKEYALGDAYWAWKIWQKTKDFWPQKERNIWNLIVEEGYKGVPITIDSLDSSITLLEKKVKEYENIIPYEKKLSLVKLKESCMDIGIPPPSTTKKDSLVFHEWLEEYGDFMPHTKILSKYRSARKIKTNLHRIKEFAYFDKEFQSHVFRFSTKYFGAHTGRFSGEGGFNMQNMNRDAVEGVDLRKMFCAPKGYKIIAMDLSQIEVRVIAWLAGAWKLLKEIESSDDMYETWARILTLYKEPLPLKEYDRIHHTSIRLDTKVTVLGSQYGLGPLAFSRKNNMPIERATELVGLYRKMVNEIPQYWYHLGDLLKKAVRSPKKTLVLPLPSGRNLYYRNLRLNAPKRETVDLPDSELTPDELKLRKDGKERRGNSSYITCDRKGLDGTLWHGTLANNTTQATARDVFVESILKSQNKCRELRVMFTVHDELVCLSKDKDVDYNFKKLYEIMTTPPSWIKGLPLEAEGKILTQYEKH